MQVCNALIFSNIAILIQSFDSVGTRFRERMETINAFVKFHELPEARAGGWRRASSTSAPRSRGARHASPLQLLPHGGCSAASPAAKAAPQPAGRPALALRAGCHLSAA